MVAAIRGGAWTYGKIAVELDCSPRTVEAHVRSIATKLATDGPPLISVVTHARSTA